MSETDTELHQLLAIESGIKASSEKELTQLYKAVQKESAFDGRNSTYRPYHEDGDKQPDKLQLVAITAERALVDARKAVSRLFDIVATKDKTNTVTNASVVVDGKLVMENVPVSTLITMEKKLNDLETFVRTLPTLPLDRIWRYDANQGYFATEPVKTFTTKKVSKVLVKYDATDKHPAQTEVIQDDVQVGEWTTTFQHGGLPADRKQQILDRITRLKEAVKFARERANRVKVIDVKVADPIFDYLFAQ
jgi:hypothetical protein